MNFKNKYQNKTVKELENIVSEYYKNNFQGKCVVNKETNIEICFNSIGRSKTAFGGKRYNTIMTSQKATAITFLDKLIENAIYIGVGDAKKKHIIKYNAICFLIFKSDCNIDNKNYIFKISVMMRKGGKFQYSINEDYEI